jgi:prepilin-type N-terminal cleavage/methylation domain-containing protein
MKSGKLKVGKINGFTLIELLIALALSAIILIVIVVLTDQVFIRSQGGSETFQAQTEAAASMNTITKEIRQATKIIDAQDQTITFREYINLDDAVPSQVRFYLDGTSLKRGAIPASGNPPDYTYDPASETTKILSLRVSNGTQRIFSYYDQNGTQLVAPFTLGAITLVGVELTFEQANNPQPFKVQTKVQLRLNKTNL